MSESLQPNTDRFGRTTEYFSNDELKTRVSIHERPKDADPTATIIVPGWTGTPEVYAPVFDTVFAEGRNTAAFGYPEQEPAVELSPDEAARAEKLPPELKRRALALIHATEFVRKSDHGLNRGVDIFSHSEGFLVSVLAAHIRPQQFRDIIAYAPLGVAKDENWLRLLSGFVGQNFEKHDWGPGPTDMKALAHEYAQEQREKIREEWLSGEGQADNSNESFERYFNTYTEMLEADLTARKHAAKERGIEEFTAPSEEDHAEAARRRAISDSTFFRHLRGKPWRSFLEAKELPGVQLHEMMRDLSDEHDIGFAIAVSGDDSVMNAWRTKLQVIHDVLAIKKRKPRVHIYTDAEGHERERTVFDSVVKTLTLPGGGHQGVVGYPQTTREVERALTRLNHEHI
jgi:hypothetical protein